MFFFKKKKNEMNSVEEYVVMGCKSFSSSHGNSRKQICLSPVESQTTPDSPNITSLVLPFTMEPVTFSAEVASLITPPIAK